MTLESYRPGSYTNALYTGDFPAIADEGELDRMVELYRRDAGSRLPPGEPPPSAALSPTPTPAAEPTVADPEIYPTPIPEDTTDYGGGGDTDFGGKGRPAPTRPTAKPVAELEPYPEDDWKAHAPPPPNGGRWVGEEISHTAAPSEAESPGTFTEIGGGLARAGTGFLKNAGHIASYVDKKIGKWTDTEIITKLGESIDGFVDGLDQKAQGIVPPRTLSQAWDKGYGTFANWVIGKTVEGGAGMVAPLAIARVGGLPAVLAYGGVVGAVEEARREGSTNASVTTATLNGMAQMGLPIKVMKMTETLGMAKRVAAQALAFAGIGGAAPYTAALPKAVAGQGYDTPTGEQVGEGALIGATTGAGLAPFFGAKGPVKTISIGGEEQGPQLPPRPYPPREPPPEEQGPQLPPRPYPPREEYGPPMEQYGPLPEEQGPQLPPRPYPPRQSPADEFGPDLPPRPYPPRDGEGPKGSPETAPPSVAGDPAATAAIDAAVNPPRSRLQERVGMPVEEAPVEPAPRPIAEAPVELPPIPPEVLAAAKPATERAAPVEEAAPVRPTEVPAAERAPAPRETTTVVKPAEEAAAPKPLTTEPDHLDAARHVAKDEAGRVVGKGATPEEALADAQSRGRVPYEEAPPVQPKAAPVEVKPAETPAPTEEAPAAKPAAAPSLLRKAQPAATEEAIAKSKAQAEAATTETTTETVKPTTPTTVVRRPTKRVEVVVGKRGEGAVAEESTAQRETADAAEATQQRRLAERRAEKLPARAQEARRTSLLADEIARGEQRRGSGSERSTMEVSGRAASKGTPIEEIGEGSKTHGQATEGGIAETRSTTTTDKNLRYNDLLHDVLQGNKTLDQASEAAGSKEAGTRGRPRRNKDLADYLDNEVIPRAEKANQADAKHMERAAKFLANKKLTPERRNQLAEKLADEMEARVAKRGRSEQERENLDQIKKHRDELRGVEKKGGDAEAEANAPLYRDPDVERGAKAAKRLLNLSVNRKLQDRIKRSDDTNTLDSAHDYLNDIINDPGAKIAAPDLVELARHLKRLLPDDVQMGSYKALFKNVLGRSEEAAAQKAKESAGTYYGDEVDAIGMNPSGRDHLVKTLHELVHPVVYKYLDDIFQKQKNGEPLTAKEQKHSDTLDAIVKETTRLRDEAAISDAEYNALDYAVRAATGEQTGSERTVGGRHELVTQTMTDPLVREVMGRTEASPEFKAEMKRLGYGEPQNLWQAFKAFVKDIVGFKRGSVLDKVLDPMTDILETGAKYREDAGMGLELNSPLRGSGEAGRRWKPGDVATDGLPNQWARDKLHPLGEAFADSPLSDKARAKLEGWKSGLARRGTRAIEVASPTHKITAENADVLPAGPEVLHARALIDRATGEYKQKWGNRVQNWVRELRAGPEVAKLMNDATLAETYLTNQPTLFAQRNAHLTGDKLTRAEELQERFNNLTPEKQKLYSDVRDYYRQTHFEQRKLEYEDVVQRFLPEATPDQRTALADKLSTRRGIKEVLADPDVLSQAFGERWENSRALVKEIAKLQDTGWREGDFFPLRRYGDYVLRYGDQGTKDYGVEMFERSSEAAERRAELQKELPAGTHITDVMSKRADFSRKEFMPESALEDMARAMAKRGASEKEIEQAKDAYAYAMMRRQVSSSQAQSRMYRSGVTGASENVSQNLINHFNSTASLFGRLTHGAAETEAMRQARQQADAIERASGTPGTAADIARSKSQLDALETRFANKDPAVSQEDINHARQQHEWLVKPPSSQQTIRARETLNELEKRRAPVDGDDSTTPLGKAAGKFTAASMVYHLIRPAHLAINVADTHANAQSLLGADYGHARTAAALVKAMKDLGPSGIGRGFRNALKAVTGNMEASDWHVGDMLAQKLIDLKPGDTAHAQEMRDLNEMTKDYSLVDHTRSREVQRLSRKGGFDFGDPTGGKHPWSNVASNMMNLFAVGEHTVDSTMRMGVVKAAYDLARGRGASPAEAREEARVHAMDVMPVYGSWNTPRIASPRTPYLRDIAPATMQYKLYGFHMYAVMGGLVRKAMFRPEERAEAIKALTGLVATHSILGGVTANLFALPVVAALGAWDWINGEEKPHNYETDLKRWIADVTGSETASKFASAGLFGLAGAQQSRSLKLTNMVDVPEVRSFDKAGAGQFIMQGMTGASGDVAGQLFEGLHDLANGDYMKAGKKLLPRVLGDPLKAIDLGNEGVVDKRGRTITPASQVTLSQQITQAAGFNPYQPSLVRERRHEEESLKDEYQYRRRQAIDRYVLSGGRDMSSVRRYMSDEKNRQISPIKYQQLREAMKEERKREARPEFYGARPTKREERPFREATRFN